MAKKDSEITYVISADDSNLETDLDKAEEKVKKSTKKVEQAAEQSGKKVEQSYGISVEDARNMQKNNAKEIEERKAELTKGGYM